MRDTRTNLAVQLEATNSSSNQDIYTNALPAFLDRIDLTSMDKEGNLFAYNFMENLLKALPFELDLQPSFEVAEKLRHLYFESRNLEKIKGNKSIGFGFPLLVTGQQEQRQIAPVFIWPLHIEPSSTHTETWSISYQKDKKVLLNPAILEVIEYRQGIEAASTLKSYSEKTEVKSADLLKAINEFSSVLCYDESFNNISISPFPNATELADLPFEGAFCWSGLIGLFPSIQQEVEKELEGPLFETGIQDFKGHQFGLLDLDPYQASALRSTFINTLTIVDGPSGSGKSHFLLHLLSNILLNKQTCLLVSESIPALKEVQMGLSNMGINRYQFLFRNTQQDKPLFQELLRTAKGDTPLPSYSKDDLRILLDKARRQKAKLDENYRAVRKKVFGERSWTETVGRYMYSNRREGKELLASQLNAHDFKFDYEEYNLLEQAIDEAYPLYQKVNTLRHPLNNLSKTIFTDLEKKDGLAFIEKHTSIFSHKVLQLQQKFISKLDLYKANLIEHYDQSYMDRADIVNDLQEKIRDYTTQFGDSFVGSGKGALRFYGILSAKHKEILRAKEEVSDLFAQLLRFQKEQAYFDFSFTLDENENDMNRLSDELNQYHEELETWRTLLPAIVQEEITRLSSKNAHEKLYFEEHIISLEKELDDLLRELNAAGLYNEKLANKALTLTRRQKYLEEILEQLENTILYLKDYSPFYDWQHHWLLLPENARKVIRALIKVKPGSWLIALESWYLDNVLTANYDPSFLVEMDLLESFSANEKALRPLLKAQIPDLWESTQDTVLKELRRRDKATYNLLFGKRKEGKAYPEIKELIDADLQAITSMLPILMMTPAMARELFADVTAHFDFVILDGVQNIELTNTSHLFSLAKKQVLIGSSHQINSEFSSIMGEIQNRSIRTYQLQGQHRYNPGNLWQARNPTAFEDQMKQFKIRFAQADGRYDQASGTNEVEAQYIIRILNQIKKTPQRTFPTVGIACFTIQQRNLIADYLLKIKQKRAPGAEKIQQLERNGLGVFCVDEVAGQHFDILVISGTFGTVDSRGNLGSQINWLNSEAGKPLLHLLMGRALEELFIVNSIPPEELEELAEYEALQGTFLLANYFLYARAGELSNRKEKRDILSRMEEWHNRALKAPEDLVFRKELAYAMQPYLEQGRILEKPLHELSPYPVLVNGITEDKAAILLWPDGFASDAFSTDFSWEYRKIQELKSRGLEHLPVWSVNWWRNPSKEARRLASAIIKLDGEA